MMTMCDELIMFSHSPARFRLRTTYPRGDCRTTRIGTEYLPARIINRHNRLPKGLSEHMDTDLDLTPTISIVMLAPLYYWRRAG